jgi:hypothetical protein
MFNPKFIDELFRPQELYPKKAVKQIFEKLAHSSIMRLNEASMDKVEHIEQHSSFSLIHRENRNRSNLVHVFMFHRRQSSCSNDILFVMFIFFRKFNNEHEDYRAEQNRIRTTNIRHDDSCQCTILFCYLKMTSDSKENSSNVVFVVNTRVTVIYR